MRVLMRKVVQTRRAHYASLTRKVHLEGNVAVVVEMAQQLMALE